MKYLKSIVFPGDQRYSAVMSGNKYTAVLIAFLLLSGIFTVQGYAQKAGPVNFYIETQPDSPVLLRDLTALITSVGDSRTERTGGIDIHTVFYFENRTEKKIIDFTYQEIEPSKEAGKEAGERSGFRNLGQKGLLLPGQSLRRTGRQFNESASSTILRISQVEFEDGTKWKAKPFDNSSIRKMKPIPARYQKDARSAQRTLPRSWSTIMFQDQVSKVIDGKDKNIEGLDIKTKVHQLKVSERLEMAESCSEIQDAFEIQHDDFDYDVSDFITYEYKGKVFAYEVNYSGVEGDDGYEIGVGFGGIYVDEHGAGQFKLRCDEALDLETLPQWIKDMAVK